MGIFKRVFGGNKNKLNIDPNKFNIIQKSEASSFQDLVEQHAGLSFEKQLIFGDIIGNSPWELDMDKGKIYFGQMDFPIQVLGSRSFHNDSWMWAWANTQSSIPEKLMTYAKGFKKIGEHKSIKEFTDGHFNITGDFEHKMGMVACGMLKTNCYYAANYGDGTLIVTIDYPHIPAIDEDKVENVFTYFPQLISAIEINHKEAFKNYLIDRNFALFIDPNRIEGLKNGKVVVAKFDELNRLTSLNGSI